MSVRIESLSYKNNNLILILRASHEMIKRALHDFYLDAPNYTLRQKTQKYYLFQNMQVCRTKRVEDFFAFKFF